MKTYLTEIQMADGKRMSGPEIEAESWDKAERKAGEAIIVIAGAKPSD